jgi:hypothetical protein
MAIRTFSISFAKEDFKSLLVILLKAIEKRLHIVNSENEYQLKVIEFLSTEVTLNE